MKFMATEIPGVVVVEPDVHRDARGFFLETYHARKYAAGGIDVEFVQDNHSCSVKGTLRGLHAQIRHAQGKLVRVVRGEIFEVAVDIRRGSPSFARHVAVRLRAETPRQLYLPPGFAHGFAVLSEEAEVEYKCTALHDPGDELVIAWNDPQIAIPWPVAAPLLSEKDRRAATLAELEPLLPLYEEPGP